MSERISLDEVRKVAKLARLSLSEEELERMRGDLDGILDWMTALSKLDTNGVEPTFHAVEMAAALRDDVVVDGLRRSEALRAAARSDQGGFAVPKVKEGE
ncbi:MAG: Asp-tRNA(Asn)/Glu-tRNA(Gln) amidotransferase subunit GatC [Deltaproteobacteria bacterium]|nr:Asp-tRNA(Asn)/Glu-tRNA(Gln) amidotransferase subunit GatC [Deltaproteobacteria bacterium]